MRHDPDPPLGFMVSLYLRLVESTYEHSAAKVGLAVDARKALRASGGYALAATEEAAVDAGLLGRDNMVCRLPAGHEKSLLACMCLVAPGAGPGRVAYLVAAGRDVERAHGGIAGLLGADWGGGGASRAAKHFVAAYGELATRLSAGEIGAGELDTIVIDEACDLDEDCGGDGALDLEMLLARLRAAGSACPRIVALTTLAPLDVAERIAIWLGAKAVDCGGAEPQRGRSIGADESICCDGMLYRRPRPDFPVPLPRDLRCNGDAAAEQGAAALCACFARRAEVADSPLLISVPKGSDALGLAGAIASRMRLLGDGDLDLREAADRKAGPRRALAGRGAIRAGLEYCGAGADVPLASGVAFDDERLPPAFRMAVMSGVESGAISAVVSSSARRAGAGPSPFMTVLVCRPGAGEPTLAATADRASPSALGYERVAEMAGRVGRDKRGEVFVVATSAAECDALRRLWGESPVVASALGGRSDAIRSRIASHLVGIAKESGGATLDDMMSRMSSTWFWASSGAADKAALAETVEGLLDELVALQLVAGRRSGGGGSAGAGLVYEPTDLGRVVCESPLPALWAARAVRELGGLVGTGGPPAAHYCSDAGAAPLAALLADVYPRDAAKAGGAAPASRLIAARAAAVAEARALLCLADILRNAPGLAGGQADAIVRAAVRRMSDSFEAPAGVLEQCAAQTERERAALLVDRLAETTPRMREIAPSGASPPAGQAGGSRRDAWLPADPDSVRSECAFTTRAFAAAAKAQKGDHGRRARQGAMLGGWTWANLPLDRPRQTLPAA